MLGIAVRLESYQGVSELNNNVNLMEFFTQQVFPELQDASHANRPMVKATALKFVCTFRKQFTKEQLIALIPVMGHHLSSPSIVVHTLAAYSIERILMATEESAVGVKNYKICRSDLTNLLEPLFTGLFAIIDNAAWNENEHVMKCNMRLLARIGPDVIPLTNIVFGKLAAALERVCKNPRNPSYNHYLFESIAAIVRNSCAQDSSLVAQLEALLFPPFQSVLQADISEFTPYVFQVLAQLLEFRPDGAGLGDAYKQLFQPLLHVSLWERKGNVPALARLLQAYIKQAPHEVMGSIVPLLGIFQLLNASSSTEASAFELLRALTTYFPQENLLPYTQKVFDIILTKLIRSKNHKYRPLVVSYFSLFSGIFGGQMCIDTLNKIQAGLSQTFLSQVWIVELDKVIPTRLDAKIQVIGLSRLLCDSSAILDGNNGQQVWAEAFKGVMKVLLSESLSSQVVESLDVEPEIAYDSAYSKLSLAAKKPLDPFPSIVDPVAAFTSAVQSLASQRPGILGPIIQGGIADDSKLALGFQNMLQKTGAQIV
jgi:exportin-2 (importin alpha re-exporter)